MNLNVTSRKYTWFPQAFFVAWRPVHTKRTIQGFLGIDISRGWNMSNIQWQNTPSVWLISKSHVEEKGTTADKINIKCKSGLKISAAKKLQGEIWAVEIRKGQQ